MQYLAQVSPKITSTLVLSQFNNNNWQKVKYTSLLSFKKLIHYYFTLEKALYTVDTGYNVPGI